MNTSTGLFCDGDTLSPVPVTLEFQSNGHVTISGADIQIDLPLDEIKVSDRLGSMPRFLYLPNGASIESPDNHAVDDALATHRRGRINALIHFLETHSPIAAGATLMVVGLVFLMMKFGLPALSARTAQQIPDSIRTQIGNAALASISQVLGRSNLSETEHRQINARLDTLLQSGESRTPVRLAFASMGEAYPNAFALPGGIIVISDELVALATEEGELEAVLAHELGHIEYRHGIQSVLRSSFALLLVTSLTGDLSTLTTLAGTIPFIILQRGYSRAFELEADRYAQELLQTAGIDPRHLASILQKLNDARPEQGVDYSYLSTHPRTQDRIEALTESTQ